MIRIAILTAMLATPAIAASRPSRPVVVPIVVTPPPTPEPDAGRMDLARTFVETMDAEKQIRAAEQKTIGNGAAQYDKYVPALIATRMQIANPKDYAVIRANVVGLLADEGQKLIDDSLPIMIDAMIRRYAQHYDADELKGLIAFYRSPLGQRVVAENPGIAADSEQFQQGAIKGIIAAHLAETTPKVLAMLAPLLTKAGINMPAVAISKQPNGFSPL